MTLKQVVSWGAGVAAGAAALIWISGMFLSKESHREWVNSHREWSAEVLQALRSDMSSLKVDAKELKEDHRIIIRKLDNLELRLMNDRKVATFSTNGSKALVGRNFNPYE